MNLTPTDKHGTKISWGRIRLSIMQSGFDYDPVRIDPSPLCSFPNFLVTLPKFKNQLQVDQKTKFFRVGFFTVPFLPDPHLVKENDFDKILD